MIKALKYKNSIIPGYFISEEGRIYNADGVEQELKLYPGQRNHPYFYFKGYEVHKMMCHSFFGYKEGFDVHHINENKLDNRLPNLMYLTRADHLSLHHNGKKRSVETKEKMRAAHKGKKQIFCVELDKVFESMQQAARELKLSAGNIHSCCNGKYKSTGGYHFSYYTGDSK